jgi:hypothetical protein
MVRQVIINFPVISSISHVTDVHFSINITNDKLLHRISHEHIRIRSHVHEATARDKGDINLSS